MESISALLRSLSVILTYIVIGVVLSKRGIITDKNRQSFIDFVIKITLPCMVFKSFLGDMTAQMIKEGALVLAISSGVCIFAWVAGLFIYKFAEPKKRSIMKFSLLVGNIGFIGMPLIAETFGDIGTFYGSFYLISNVVFNWSVGIAFLAPDVKGKDLVKKVAFNPGIIGVVLGVGRMLLGIKLPYTAVTVVTALGNMTAPLGIILIGAILAGCEFKTVFQKDVIYASLTKLIMLPACLWVFLKIFGGVLNVGPEAYNVLMILTGMPAGATTAILAESYGQDYQFASKMVFVTTVFCLVTVPVMAMIM